MVSVARIEARSPLPILREVARLPCHHDDPTHPPLVVLRIVDEARALGLDSPALTQAYERARRALDAGPRLLLDEERDEIARLIDYARAHRDPGVVWYADALLGRRQSCADDPIAGGLHTLLEREAFWLAAR